jgi:hypothetical protein
MLSSVVAIVAILRVLEFAEMTWLMNEHYVQFTDLFGLVLQHIRLIQYNYHHKAKALKSLSIFNVFTRNPR